MDRHADPYIRRPIHAADCDAWGDDEGKLGCSCGLDAAEDAGSGALAVHIAEHGDGWGRPADGFPTTADFG